ncbi:hypothetical protein DM860_000116 [Cuscuta australis]|uniref:SWIM-type domain-containing protein n=1 Tax=Cuscuta australis TaxID=267555 RepID=A0A328CVQ3_9ASTE|nr:hypothetical protein DM860_000116 [Cuscuta australis]
MEVHGDNDYAMGFHSQPATPTKYQEVPNEGSSSYVERHWVLQCPDNYIPKVSMVFKDLDDAIRFYSAYAAEAGFDVRKTTTTKKEGSVIWQYVVCSREGCMASVAFHILGHDAYVLSIFEEQHNHPLTSLPYRPFLKINRNIGTMKSYRLFKESVGGEDASEYQISDVSGMISTVRYCERDGTTHCSCKNYERIGLLCRHIFVVFKNLKIEQIPDFYVTNRWCKFHLLKPMFDVGGSEMDKESFTDQNKTLVSRLMSDIHFCIALVEHTPDLLLAFSNTINQHKEALIDKLQDGKLLSDTSLVFENFCGTSAPSEVRVLPPAQVSTKGSGKRINGGKEVSIEESKKTKRLCRTCKKYGFHEIRNCPMNHEK